MTMNGTTSFYEWKKNYCERFNPFHVTGLFLYSLKTVFKGCRKRPVTQNGLIFLEKNATIFVNIECLLTSKDKT